MSNTSILAIENLRTHFFTYGGVVKAVDGLNLSIGQKEVLGIVGETGCGKSVAARSILNLIPEPGKIVSGRIFLNGDNLLEKSDDELRKIRGGKIAMIFQNPLTSLNPVFTIGDQVSHIIRIHQTKNREEIRKRLLEMFLLVRLPNPLRLLTKYPHELSGGQLQRIMIAMALSCRPQLLIADEPTTALDVTIQAQILTLMLQLKEELNTSIMMITHDLGVVAETCDRVAVMYAGKIVETGGVSKIFAEAKHPYTKGLMYSAPGKAIPGQKLKTIKGTVPDLTDLPTGCLFAPRCPISEQLCREEEPRLEGEINGHQVACFKSGVC
ncbi:ABC transporter ATP-binding protein [bacterium]|nr:ABC transporter ATP-binding protein [bacterium]